jgi:hypothetical protein
MARPSGKMFLSALVISIVALSVAGIGCRWNPPAATSIETLKLAEDQYQHNWDIVIKIGAALGAAIAFGVGLWQFSRTQQDNFRLKAVELALQGESAYAAKERAKFIQKFFKGVLPADFLQDVDTTRFGFGTAAKRRKEFIALMAANPSQRHQIMKDWAALFPDDVWVKATPQDTLQWLGELMKNEKLTVPPRQSN